MSKYNLSVNILRDKETEFSYTPTPNGERVASQMVQDFQKGIHAFNIIGSYGTGKSSFLLALEKSLAGKQRFYSTSFLGTQQTHKSITLVGSYSSLIEAFATELQLTEAENIEEHILTEILTRYNSLTKKSLMLIVIDEFGKFLEYAAKNGAEKELYFVQQLAELVNHPDRNIIFITTVHQSFESYAHNIRLEQRNEWTKVKGRFREIIFNEPVEQLLYLASEHFKSLSKELSVSKTQINSALKLFQKSKAFDTADEYSKEISATIFPLDLFAAHVLTLSLQRYGQNERSLFSFLQSTDHTSISKWRTSRGPFYNLSDVYDYLNYNLYSFLVEKSNPNLAEWSSIRSAIEKAERDLSKNINESIALIKAIGLLNIFAAEGSVLDEKFLLDYSKECLGIKNAEAIVEGLLEAKVIRYRNYKRRYIPFSGTDVDFQQALFDAEGQVDRTTDITALVEKHYNLAPLLARQHAFETGSSRYFNFLISKSFKNPVPAGEIDGFINLVFTQNFDLETTLAAANQQEEAVLYGYYLNTTDIADTLFDIEKTQKALHKFQEDDVAKKEFNNILTHQKKLLNHYILDGLHTTNVRWFWKEGEVEIRSKRQLNNLLSKISKQVYHSAPLFKNELVNKHKLSASIGTAKKRYFTALSQEWEQPDLGFPADKFPPEKTIYLTLLKQNDLLHTGEQEIVLPAEHEFFALWEVSNAFLCNARQERLSVGDLVKTLQQRPFRLKHGFIDFWVPSFLFLQRSTFALYSDKSFVPDFSPELLDLLSKQPATFYIKSFDLEGTRLNIFNNYRQLINLQSASQPSKQTFIETIKPFLKLYRNLKDYTKQTKRLSPAAIAIRAAIAFSTDPEGVFFEAFPAALGSSLQQINESREALKAYSENLQEAIRELLHCYSGLVERFETFIRTHYGYENAAFEQYKESLQKRFKKLKRDLLTLDQKVFVQRINSLLDDRTGWLASLAQALVGRNLDEFRDEDEVRLYDKFKTMILSLDGLTELSMADIDEHTEEVMGVRLDSFMQDVKQSLVRLPKSRMGEVAAVEEKLKTALSSDKSLDIAALAKLLNELLTS